MSACQNLVVDSVPYYANPDRVDFGKATFDRKSYSKAGVIDAGNDLVQDAHVVEMQVGVALCAPANRN